MSEQTECLYVGGPWNGKRYRVAVHPTVATAEDGTEYVRTHLRGTYEDGRPFLVYCVKGQEPSIIPRLVGGYRGKPELQPDLTAKHSS